MLTQLGCSQRKTSLWFRLLLVSFIGCWAFSVPVRSGSAQEFTVMDVNETAGTQQTTLFQSLQSGSGNAEQVKTFLTDYYLARWTIPDNFRQLHAFRRELVTEAAGMSAPGRTTFLTAAMEMLAEMAKDPKMAPSVRFNAVLTIGSLDESINDSAETPYAPAVPVLAALMSDEAKLPDYIVVGGLLGMVRHAALGGMDEANKKVIIDTLLAMLEPAFARSRDFSPEVADYIQCRAVEGLAAFKSVSGYGEGTRILDTFRRLLDEQKTSLALTDAALRGLSVLDYSAIGDYDFKALANLIVQLYPQLIEKQIAFIDNDILRKQVSGNSTGGIAGGMGGMSSGMGTAGGMGMGNMGTRSTASAGGNQSVDSSEVEPILGQIVYDMESYTAAIKGTGETGGILSGLKEEDAESKAALEKILAEIDRTNRFFTYGAQSLEKNFDPKAHRLPNVRKGSKAYYVSLSEIKNFLEDQLQTIDEWNTKEKE